MGFQNTIVATDAPSFPWNTGDELDAVAVNNIIIQLQNQISSLQSTLALVQFQVSGGNLGGVTLNWGGNSLTTAGTYVVTATSPYQFSIASIDVNVGNTGGSFVVTLRINNVPVGGLTNILVNSGTKVRFFAKAPNVVFQGQEVDIVISAIVGTPENGYVCINPTSAAAIPVFAACQGTAAGTSTAVAITTGNARTTGSAAGTSTAIGRTPGETVEGVIITNPGQIIFASIVPGSTSATTNQFGISAGRVVLVNGVADVTQTAITELYYHLHFVYAQNTAGVWSRWISAGNWVVQPDPFPAPVSESAEGTIVTTVGPAIVASLVPGSSAITGATVGAGLNSFTLTSVGGQVAMNGTPDGATANIIELYYHNHQLFTLNNAGLWFAWQSASFYAGPVASPISSTPTININTIPQEPTNSTFVVSGTLQGYGSTTNINLIRNSTNVGALLGSPGTLPTNWSNALGGLTQTIIASGTDPATSLPYIDIQLAGTTTGTSAHIYLDNTAAIAFPAAAFTPYTFSAYLAIISGTTTNVNTWELQLDHYSANGVTFIQTDDVFTSTFNPTLTRQVLSTTTTATTTSFRPAVLITFAVGVAVSIRLRIAGGQLEKGAFATVFSRTPATTTGIPTLQYQDTTDSATWNAFPSNVNVTATKFSFVHPPLTVPSGAYQVSVRDANTPTIFAHSTPFQVFTAGVITISQIVFNPTFMDFPAGSPAGTPVGTVTVTTTPGVFGGTLTLSGPNGPVAQGGNGNFVLSGNTILTGNPITQGSYPLFVTATQANAVGSPLVQTTTITGTVESQPGAQIIGAGIGVINASAAPGAPGGGNIWGIVNQTSPAVGLIAILNGVQQPATAGITQLYYIGHSLHTFDGTTWKAYLGRSLIDGFATFSVVPSPIPVISLAPLTFPPVTTAPFAAEQIGTVSVTAGGQNNIVLLTLGGTFASSFSFSSTSSLQSIAGSAATLFTVAGAPIPSSPPNYPIIITATIT